MGKNKVEHEKFMRRALKLALKAKGQTNPNPLVGALLVKNGRIIGQGYHRAAGMAHAEIVALDKAGPAARGSKLYITLEPCCHFGQTPPCVNRIAESGVKEVIFAMYDPNPLNNGKGARFLRRHGIKVSSGILEKEARELNQVFIKYIAKKIPFVTVKVAQSLDGKIATQTGYSRWISCASSRRFVHKLRSSVDAVLVGINTILTDDPLLSCRLRGHLYKRQPKKIIVDSRLRLRPKMKIFSAVSPGQVIIATTRFAPCAKVLSFRNKGAWVIIARDEGRKVNLRDLLKKLAGRGIAHVLIEGGGEIIASALEKRLVDRMLVFISPKIVGGRDAPTAVEGKGVQVIEQAKELKDMKFRKVGSDLLIEGRVKAKLSR